MKNKVLLIFILLLAGSMIMLQSCKKKDKNDNDTPSVQDNVPPQIGITSPTSETSYLSSENTVTIKGFANDNKHVNRVQWMNDKGQSGTTTGTTSWELTGTQLQNGDNLFTFIAFDDANNTDTAQLLVTFNEVYTFVGPPQITPDAFFVNDSTQVSIKITIADAPNIVDNSIKLVEVNQQGTFVKDICELYDDGNLEIHGDEIQSDGVYCNLWKFSEPMPTTKYYRVKISLDQGGTTVDAFSQIKSVSVVDEVSSTDVQEILDIELQADEYFQTQLSSVGLDQAVSQTIDWLETQSVVVNTGMTASGDIWIDFDYGLPGMILTNTDENEGGGGQHQISDRTKNATIPVSKQTRGTNANYHKSSNEDENAVLDKDVMLFAPNWTQFTDWGTEFLENVNTIIDASKCPNFNIDYRKNSDADLDAIRSFSEFGLVVIHTHGGLDKNNDVIFLTGDEATYEIDEILDWLLDRIMPIPHLGKTLWAVKPSFVGAYNGNFPNSIIYNGSCESAFNNTMANAFLSKGANTYFGFSQTVKSWFDRDMANQLFPKLITNGKTTGEAFVAGQHDDNEPPAYFTMLGNNATHFISDFVNGNFEEGDLTGWYQLGDGRVITQLGFIAPYQGSYMGIISTGLGYTVETGSISQNFCLTEDATTLKINWNFLSEEFIEWVGSQYQDYFTISVIDENGIETEMFRKTIDDIYYEYGVTAVSPDIVFDQGDVYGTGWQYLELDISSFAGQGITLVLGAGDVGDSVYDTAILLDDIQIE